VRAVRCAAAADAAARRARVAPHSARRQLAHLRLRSTYAALLLHDDGQEVSAEKINAVLKAAGVTVEPYWAGLFAKTLSVQSLDKIITNVGTGACALDHHSRRWRHARWENPRVVRIPARFLAAGEALCTLRGAARGRTARSGRIKSLHLRQLSDAALRLQEVAAAALPPRLLPAALRPRLARRRRRRRRRSPRRRRATSEWCVQQLLRSQMAAVLTRSASSEPLRLNVRATVSCYHHPCTHTALSPCPCIVAGHYCESPVRSMLPPWPVLSSARVTLRRLSIIMARVYFSWAA
jgi:60s Acidic ribosomal protein